MGSAGWRRMDIPGTLATVVKQDGKFPYLVDKKGNWVRGAKDVWYKGVVTATAEQMAQHRMRGKREQHRP